MTAEVELLPCPFCGVYWTEKEIEQQPEVPVSDIELLPLHYDELPEIPEDIVVRMQAYARANVAHAVAPLQAEIDALRTRLEDTIRDSTNKIEALRAEMDALEAENARLREDAERYLCLSSMATQQADYLGPIFRIDVRRTTPQTLFNFDAAVDHARAALSKEEGK